MGDSGARIVERRLHLVAEPAVMLGGLVGAAHPFGGIEPDPLADRRGAVLGGVEQVEAGEVELALEVLDALVQGAPEPGPVGALGSQRLFQDAQLQHDRPAAGLADDRGAADGLGFDQALGHGRVDGVGAHAGLSVLREENRLIIRHQLIEIHSQAKERPFDWT